MAIMKALFLVFTAGGLTGGTSSPRRANTLIDESVAVERWIMCRGKRRDITVRNRLPVDAELRGPLLAVGETAALNALTAAITFRSPTSRPTVTRE